MALCLRAGVEVQIERRCVDAFRHVLGAAAFMLQPAYEEYGLSASRAMRAKEGKISTVFGGC